MSHKAHEVALICTCTALSPTPGLAVAEGHVVYCHFLPRSFHCYEIILLAEAAG